MWGPRRISQEFDREFDNSGKWESVCLLPPTPSSCCESPRIHCCDKQQLMPDRVVDPLMRSVLTWVNL